MPISYGNRSLIVNFLGEREEEERRGGAKKTRRRRRTPGYRGGRAKERNDPEAQN